MKYSAKGFKIPEYGDEADIPSLFRENVEILERLLDNMGGLGKIYTGSTEPEAETYIWFAPYNPSSADMLELSEYTGEENRLHIEAENGSIYTAGNTTLSDGGEDTTVVIIE